MKIIVKESYEDLSKEAARIIKREMQKKPNLVLGLATGSTPIGLYKELIRIHKDGLSFSQITTFNLDEYFGLDSRHPQSYHFYMQKNLFDHIDVKPENIHIPDGKIEDVKRYCAEYEETIKRVGGIDLQILGIGSNGHIGFNEPGSPFASRTHLAKLAESTIEDNVRFFEKKGDVPRFAITMGLQTIFEAKKIILLASGQNKANAVVKSAERPITSQVPASILQKHSNSVFLLDKAAASQLKQY